MAKKKTRKERAWLIDAIYKKFTAKAFQNLTSPEFFEFFNNMMKNGEQTFQFSNKHLEIEVDKRWVEEIENAVPAMQEIARDPRVIITQEELITNVVQVRKINAQVVRHIISHSYLLDAYDEKTGEVRPAKMLNVLKEETWDTYENRFVYTLLVKTYEFVKKRYDDMRNMVGDDYGANLKIKADALSNMEHLWVDSHMKIVQKDQFFDDDDPTSIFARIKKLYEALVALMSTRFAKEMKKFSKVYPPLVPTNAIKKNPYLKKCHKLWDFIWAYFEVGYTVTIYEQNPEINAKFQQDIIDNIMFTYIILKGYLENSRDRMLDKHNKARKTQIRPKYIKQIIEEFVESFDLPDVEVRKILVEELTKEDLMREDREERYRLVEEKRKADERKKREALLEKVRAIKEKERQAEKAAKAKERLQEKKAKEKEIESKKKAKEKELLKVRYSKNMAVYQKEMKLQLEAIQKRHDRLVNAAEKEAEKEAAKQARLEARKAKAEADKAARAEAKLQAKKAKADAEKTAKGKAEKTAGKAGTGKIAKAKTAKTKTVKAKAEKEKAADISTIETKAAELNAAESNVIESNVIESNAIESNENEIKTAEIKAAESDN